ncbi:hypothetical protein HPP92_001305 [Vanilla planifolia]|uniref:Uncharacterized protein n=1 Tax=Vanilla planifolia TaxID=51239 RepID=A0A835VDF2_VANPL|nr:hypothetical protein HPP92_001305 [Vanilla planifolia]
MRMHSYFHQQEYDSFSDNPKAFQRESMIGCQDEQPILKEKHRLLTIRPSRQKGKRKPAQLLPRVAADEEVVQIRKKKATHEEVVQIRKKKATHEDPSSSSTDSTNHVVSAQTSTTVFNGRGEKKGEREKGFLL